MSGTDACMRAVSQETVYQNNVLNLLIYHSAYLGELGTHYP